MLSTRDEYPAEYDTLHQEIGETLASWAALEHAFAALFHRLTAMAPRLASRVFFSGRNFATRADMLRAAIGATGEHREIREFSQAALKRGLQYSGFRNTLAHGVPTVVPALDCPWDHQPLVIEPGFDFFKDAPITITDMQTARPNFLLLNSMVQQVAKWNEEEPGLAPHKYLELVRELPNPPQSQAADPSVVRRLGLLLAQDMIRLSLIPTQS